MWYFAYGSNLNITAVAEWCRHHSQRTPHLKPGKPAVLDNYRLCFPVFSEYWGGGTADIVYDPAHYAPLALYLDRSLAADGTILLTESLRADASVFLEGLLEHGFADEKRALWVMENGRRERTWLHTLQRSRGVG